MWFGFDWVFLFFIGLDWTGQAAFWNLHLQNLIFLKCEVRTLFQSLPSLVTRVFVGRDTAPRKYHIEILLAPLLFKHTWRFGINFLLLKVVRRRNAFQFLFFCWLLPLYLCIWLFCYCKPSAIFWFLCYRPQSSELLWKHWRRWLHTHFAEEIGESRLLGWWINFFWLYDIWFKIKLAVCEPRFTFETARYLLLFGILQYFIRGFNGCIFLGLLTAVNFTKHIAHI